MKTPSPCGINVAHVFLELTYAEMKQVAYELMQVGAAHGIEADRPPEAHVSAWADALNEWATMCANGDLERAAVNGDGKRQPSEEG